MNRNQHFGVFLMEMAVVVLFFILCAAVCIQTFVKAEVLSRQAVQLNQSVLIAESTAEVWKQGGGNRLLELFKAESEPDHNGYTSFFDKNGSTCVKEMAVYVAYTNMVSSSQAEITVKKDEKTLYSFTVYRHEKEGG
ncbi:hypothetical protein [Clostridium sp. E02]|uniref:hypothetical protein n=1 Tax=Clostridium sp. E02 TaxID=2487134 RepID=UPI000F51ED5C|nr:hypothetical protein [Clostridium sp. E02]